MTTSSYATPFHHTPLLHEAPAYTIDPVDEAESNGLPLHAALAMQLLLSEQRQQLAVDAGDTHMGDTLERHIAIAKRIGFVGLVEIPFVATTDYDDSKYSEVLRVLVHPPTGMLLSVESYSPSSAEHPRVNSSQLYFVVSRQKEHIPMASGGYESLSNPGWRVDPACYSEEQGYLYPEDLLFVGHLDTRDCLASQFAQLLTYNPQKRPISPRFECIDALGHRQDFRDLTDAAGNTLYKAIGPYRRSRLRQLCAAHPELDATLFGVEA